MLLLEQPASGKMLFVLPTAWSTAKNQSRRPVTLGDMCVTTDDALQAVYEIEVTRATESAPGGADPDLIKALYMETKQAGIQKAKRERERLAAGEPAPDSSSGSGSDSDSQQEETANAGPMKKGHTGYGKAKQARVTALKEFVANTFNKHTAQDAAHHLLVTQSVQGADADRRRRIRCRRPTGENSGIRGSSVRRR